MLLIFHFWYLRRASLSLSLSESMKSNHLTACDLHCGSLQVGPLIGLVVGPFSSQVISLCLCKDGRYFSRARGECIFARPRSMLAASPAKDDRSLGTLQGMDNRCAVDEDATAVEYTLYSVCNS